MPRDVVLLEEMIEAGGRIVALVGRLDPEDPAADRDLLVSTARDDVAGMVGALREIAREF